MLSPMLVLPVPGAPTKQRIEPDCFPFNRITASCWKMRFFTLSRPEWPAFSAARASSMDISFASAFFQGRLVSRSSQSVSMPASGLFAPSPLMRFSTLRPSFRAASFMPASSSFSSRRRTSVTFSGCMASSSFCRYSICFLMADSRYSFSWSSCWADWAADCTSASSRPSSSMRSTASKRADRLSSASRA